MSVENSFVNTQNDYSVKRQDVVPSYIYSRIYQQTGGQNVTIDTSNPESIFELPPKVMNLSQSVLKFTATPQAAVAGVNWFFQECVAGIRQIQLMTRGNQIICDINNLDKYTKIVLKSDVTKNDAEERDPGLLLINNSTSRYGAVAGNLVTYKYDQTTLDLNPSVHRPFYAVPSTAAAAVDPILFMELSLSQIKNTILALDKDFYFNEVMLLRIVWNPYTSWGWGATAINNPSGGAVALALPIAITNLTLNLALENNPAISAGLISTVKTHGMEVVVPFVYPFKYTAAGTPTQQNVTLRINGTNGRHLKKIYHSVFAATETILTRYLNTNANTTNIVSYYTMIDNQRRQQFDLLTANDDDIDYVRNNLKNSLATVNTDVYRYNWFVFEKFDNHYDESVDCIDSGLPLNVERKWDFVATTAAANYNHYSFAVCSRILSITPLGISIHS